MTTTLTNLDALWSTSASPFTLTATEGSGVSASLTLSTLSTLTPGRYPQGSALPDGGASVALSFAGNSCQVVSGSVRLASLTTDGAGVGSVLATFALACAVGPGETDEVTGCVRYAATDSADASAYDASWDDAGAEAGALLSPCLGMSHAFFVSGPPLALYVDALWAIRRPRVFKDSMMAVSMKYHGISRVNRDEVEKLIRGARSSGAQVFTLKCGIRDKPSLFSATREVLPLDPPLNGGRDSWDALEDSLWSGLHAVPESRVLIAWPDASEMYHTSSKDFETAIAIFEDVARTLDDPTVTKGRVTKVVIVLGGEWN